MKYVLDASVAIKWVLAEPDSPKAIAIRDDYRKQLHELLAPDVFPTEVAHSLTRAERKGIVKKGEAAVLVADVLSTPPDIHPSIALLSRAVDISSDLRVGVYDCLYVALAERETCELLTADQQLVSRLQRQFPFIKPL